MSNYQTELLDFAAQWAPYGGGDEHVLPTFGLDLAEYYRRLLQLLDSPAARSIDPILVLQLREQCLERLSEPVRTAGSRPQRPSASASRPSSTRAVSRRRVPRRVRGE
ncbi:hypothetical protein ACN94_18225 [Gordonia paraffinivorans]|uniref:DUF3263 domain-containing protein n=1 Tax=Gordonia paraffinivorans TaxID=175628 RepID=UPI000D61DD14|nr:DUF3263 domain-containing protein [Gordonia paraffinivorans]MBY4575499.1 hypothetical protein [Gordonia paraffinivorans]PWD41393.1 hypothetical protein ACN93_19810 [Gordonia paraffinivorans]